MFEDFFNHRCNIYHLKDDKVDVGYGIQATVIKKPSKVADLKEIPCHFHIRQNGHGMRIVQKEPYSEITGTEKISLPTGTDIRMNDVIEDCQTGIKYRANIPKEVHGGHHIIATLFRDDGTGAAI